MVRRRIPLHRRLRMNVGPLIAGATWAVAAVVCILLYPFRANTSGGVAIAVVRSVPVMAPESGRVAQVSVSPGQAVQAGEVIAVVEVPGLMQQLTAAQAEVRALEQELGVAAVERARRFERDVDGARTAWLAARVALESDRATLVGLELDLARMTASGVDLPAALTEAKRVERDALAVAVAAREDEAAALERAFGAAQARAGGAEAATMQARLDAALATAASLEARLAACTLRAQTAGIVSAIPSASGSGVVNNVTLLQITPGGWAQAGVPLLQITELSTQLAMVYVNPSLAREVAPGQAIAMRAPSGETIEAQVSTIGASVEVVPLRQQRDPAVPEWGIPITLQAVDRALMPGEALAVEF